MSWDSGACAGGTGGNLIRRAARRVLHWRFRLFQQHRHNRLVLEHVAGRLILVLPQVMNPTVFGTGEFLASELNERLVPPGSKVLDMGTGSGVGAVFAAQWAGHVVAVDINPTTVRCARINALLNQVEGRVDVREGDLFDPVQNEQFDVVLFNPPFFEGEPGDDMERALWSTDIAERFAAGLPARLLTGGYALLVLSTEGVAGRFLEALRMQGMALDVVATRGWMAETLTVYRAAQTGRQAG